MTPSFGGRAVRSVVLRDPMAEVITARVFFCVSRSMSDDSSAKEPCTVGFRIITFGGFIAESRVEIDASRLLVLRTAYEIDQRGAAAVRDEISGIKFYVANMVLRVLDRAIQVHGALGVTDDIILSAIYRHERGARIWDGADEVHKQTLARSILKKYGLDLKKK